MRHGLPRHLRRIARLQRRRAGRRSPRLGIEHTIRIINKLAPRWAGFNLLAPTYEISAHIATGLGPDIKIMVGGHPAKAMPTEILTDPRMARCAALVLGEGETRLAELLADHRVRADLPGVMWLDPILTRPAGRLRLRV